MRHDQNNESKNLSEVPGAWSKEQLDALMRRAKEWLVACLVAELDFLQVGPDDWPSTAAIEAP